MSSAILLSSVLIHLEFIPSGELIMSEQKNRASRRPTFDFLHAPVVQLYVQRPGLDGAPLRSLAGVQRVSPLPLPWGGHICRGAAAVVVELSALLSLTRRCRLGGMGGLPSPPHLLLIIMGGLQSSGDRTLQLMSIEDSLPSISDLINSPLSKYITQN